MKRTVTIIALVGLALAASTAHAIPALQLYIPGSTYDAVRETWVVTDNAFDVWVLGDVGQYGPIYDVFLAASFYGTGSMGISSVGGAKLDKVLDASDPAARFAGTGFDKGVGTHAEYANANAHDFWAIGDFTSTNAAIGDYMSGVPGSFPDVGQINVYRVEITGYDMVHFDAFDHMVSGDHIRYVKAPFSHDASGGGTPPIPEPGTLALLGGGLAGLAMRRRRST